MNNLTSGKIGFTISNRSGNDPYKNDPTRIETNDPGKVDPTRRHHEEKNDPTRIAPDPGRTQQPNQPATPSIPPTQPSRGIIF